jgi:hypothetical protein
MSSFFPNGTQFSFSTALGAAIPVTAITNADPAVASATAPPTDGSIVVVTSGWSALNDTVARTTGEVAGTSFELEGVDTTDTTIYPAGEGVGSVAVASSFVGLTQINDATMSGGEQQFYQFQYVEDKSGRQRQKPTYKNAMVLTLTMDYDPTLGWYDDLITVDQAGALIVLKTILPSGDTILYLGYPSFNPTPTFAKNTNQQVTATFSLVCRPIRYAAA